MRNVDYSRKKIQTGERTIRVRSFFVLFYIKFSKVLYKELHENEW